MGANINFVVNENKCVKCGLCGQDCPVRIIEINEFPELKNPDYCIKCQHCLAICPTGAISILGNNPDDELSIKDIKFDFEQFKKLIKGRRSVRKYKNESLENSVLQELCKTALHAPTAKNNNNIHYTVISGEALSTIREKVYEGLRNSELPAEYSFFKKIAANFKNYGTDKFFAGAPHIVIASAPKDYLYLQMDSIISLSYFELLANTMGIGTLWNGFLTVILKQLLPDVQEYLNIPEDNEIGYVMTFGKPAVKYHRTVNRDAESRINFV